MPLDGELYNFDLSRQQIMSIVKQLEPDDRWHQISEYVFDMLCPERWLAPGHIKNPYFEKVITSEMIGWFNSRATNLVYRLPLGAPFRTVTKLLERYHQYPSLAILQQERLPLANGMAQDVVKEALENISVAGGEGLILRDPFSVGTMKRCHSTLKVKKLKDMEGEVIGYVTGRETDKGSKLLGKVGALILKISGGKRLELAGSGIQYKYLDFTSTAFANAEQWAIENPGKEVPLIIWAEHFPRGTIVTFRYRGLSDDGIPQEARYWRIK